MRPVHPLRILYVSICLLVLASPVLAACQDPEGPTTTPVNISTSVTIARTTKSTEGSIASTLSQNWRDTTQLVYRYGDSSVPPQHHRSYRIDVTASVLEVTVDSYGDILAHESYDITREQFDGLLASLSRNAIRNVDFRDSGGCTGGTTETISTYSKGTLIFSGTVYHCGGQDFGDLGGSVKAFADNLRALVPDLPDLLQKTR